MDEINNIIIFIAATTTTGVYIYDITIGYIRRRKKNGSGGGGGWGWWGVCVLIGECVLFFWYFGVGFVGGIKGGSLLIDFSVDVVGVVATENKE